jgi:hypothetical protein
VSIVLGYVAARKLTTHSFKPKSPKDFSALPTELLQIVLRHVASQSLEGPSISPDLFKARLISRTFSRVALDVFTSLVAYGDIGAKCACKYADYTILHLPPKSGTLARVANTFAKADKIISGMVTKVVYNVTCSPKTEVDELELEEYYADVLEDGMTDCECDDIGDCKYCDTSALARRNIETFEKQRKAQHKFAVQLSGDKGFRLVTKLLLSLRNLKDVQLDCKDYWDVMMVYSGHAGSYSGEESIEHGVYQQALPTIVGCMSAAPHISSLHLKRVGSTGNFLQHLVNLNLTMSHRDDMDWDLDVYEATHRSLRAADRINIILSYATGLKSLTLACSVFEAYVDGDIGDSAWLRDVLYGLTFPSLTTFELCFFVLEQKALQTLKAFLLRHKETLTRFVLERCLMDFDARLKQMEMLRDKFCLTSAKIVVGATYCGHAPEQWRKVVEAHGVPLAAESPFVDIGAYVVKPGMAALAFRNLGKECD